MKNINENKNNLSSFLKNNSSYKISENDFISFSNKNNENNDNNDINISNSLSPNHKRKEDKINIKANKSKLNKSITLSTKIKNKKNISCNTEAEFDLFNEKISSNDNSNLNIFNINSKNNNNSIKNKKNQKEKNSFKKI